jgi:hypothetical protein
VILRESYSKSQPKTIDATYVAHRLFLTTETNRNRDMPKILKLKHKLSTAYLKEDNFLKKKFDV